VSPDLLSPGEYKRLARHLRELQNEPADLVSSDAADLIRACEPVIDKGRVTRLLARGFLLSQVIERWQARAIWVVSRADAHYPRRLKTRLREDAPAVLYGCGEIGLLDTGGLAVVGSRNVDQALIDYTLEVGRRAAKAGRTVVSGGARGIDQAAMRGALEAGGRVSGVLADGLEKTAMNREHRNLLLNGQLVLTSPFDPSAGFNVGHAMQRNKLIYALSDASLVVSSDLNKGGTWTGAVEQLDKLKLVPVYVRSTGKPSSGLDALRSKGARPWPNPVDASALDSLLEAISADASAQPPATEGLFSPQPTATTGNNASEPEGEPVKPVTHQDPRDADVSRAGATVTAPDAPPSVAADALFGVVRRLVSELLSTPKKASEVAVTLNITVSQANAWLERLVDEGVLEKRKKPAGYVVKQNGLFE
jgi:predicted Rossmann fold nucleotide-binding protein DprA/Smf involved in DNA uptake